MLYMKPFGPIVKEELDTQDCVYRMTDRHMTRQTDNIKPIYMYPQ